MRPKQDLYHPQIAKIQFAFNKNPARVEINPSKDLTIQCIRQVLLDEQSATANFCRCI